MKRLMLAAAATFALLNMASANGPIHGQVADGGCVGCGVSGQAGAYPAVPGMSCPECSARHEREKRFGLNPFLSRLMFWKKDTECGTCGIRAKLRGCFGNCAGQAAPAFNPYPNGVPGTLVFPQNPYIRSPRDWYMSDR